jgi:hypothetical protein
MALNLTALLPLVPSHPPILHLQPRSRSQSLSFAHPRVRMTTHPRLVNTNKRQRPQAQPTSKARLVGITQQRTDPSAFDRGAKRSKATQKDIPELKPVAISSKQRGRTDVTRHGAPSAGAGKAAYRNVPKVKVNSRAGKVCSPSFNHTHPSVSPARLRYPPIRHAIHVNATQPIFQSHPSIRLPRALALPTHPPCHPRQHNAHAHPTTPSQVTDFRLHRAARPSCITVISQVQEDHEQSGG